MGEDYVLLIEYFRILLALEYLTIFHRFNL